MDQVKENDTSGVDSAPRSLSLKMPKMKVESLTELKRLIMEAAAVLTHEHTLEQCVNLNWMHNCYSFSLA